MIFEIYITEQAENDLKNIFEYIAFELQSLENAMNQLNRLEIAINGLELMPERFRVYEKEPWQSRGLRIMPVNHYCVFYIPSNKTQVVTVIRVMYAGRNIDVQLNKI